VDCDGKERGERSGGSFICRGRREGSGATGRCRSISEASWAGDGVGSIAATGQIERRLRGALLDYSWRPKDEHRFAPRTGSSFRDPWVARLMHLRQRTAHSASISCRTFSNRLQHHQGSCGVRGSRIPRCHNSLSSASGASGSAKAMHPSRGQALLKISVMALSKPTHRRSSVTYTADPKDGPDTALSTCRDGDTDSANPLGIHLRQH
jgi:hypothetical protein